MTGTKSSDYEGKQFSLNQKWFKAGAYLFFLAWMGTLVVIAAQWGVRQDRLFPLIIGIPLIILIILKLSMILSPDLFTRFIPETTNTDSNASQEESHNTQSRREQGVNDIMIILWVIGFPVWLYYAGFVIGFPVYIFALAWYLTRKLRMAIFVTVIFSMFVYVLFDQILGLNFWKGVLGLSILSNFV